MRVRRGARTHTFLTAADVRAHRPFSPLVQRVDEIATAVSNVDFVSSVDQQTAIGGYTQRKQFREVSGGPRHDCPRNWPTDLPPAADF